MSDDEILAVVQAYKEGKKIQVCSPIEGAKWHDCERPMWAFDNLDYRVAPEPRKPREWSVHVVTDGVITSFPLHENMIQETVRVREVLENE
jgi:hypothetical protein